MRQANTLCRTTLLIVLNGIETSVNAWQRSRPYLLIVLNGIETKKEGIREDFDKLLIVLNGIETSVLYENDITGIDF